jgi:hypothetical protein
MEDIPSSPLEDTEETNSDIELYVDKDEENPNEVVYDLENNMVIVPNETEGVPLSSTKKVISRNVGNIKRRRFR